MLLLLPAQTIPPDQIDWLNLSDPTTFVRLIGLLIPLLTALVSKQVASAGLKALITTLLSAITAAVAVLVTSENTFN